MAEAQPFDEGKPMYPSEELILDDKDLNFSGSASRFNFDASYAVKILRLSLYLGFVMAVSSAISYHWASPFNKEFKIRGRIIARSAFGEPDPTVSNINPVSVSVNGPPAPLVIEKGKNGSLVGENGYVGTPVFEEKPTTVKKEKEGNEKLEVLWDDGFGTRSVREYLDDSKVIIRSDGGPPRWFCPVECGQPLKGSPVLFFLPGLDGTGLGLLLHHQSLGRVFEVRCLHIPVYDQTPFEGLVKLVEEAVRSEHASSPKKPIYLIAESFGGCLALAVAARNPSIDLVVIVANPGTSFGRSQLQPLLPALEALPDELHFTLPYLLSFIMGEPLKMAMANIDKGLPPGIQLQQLSDNLTSLLPRLSTLSDIVPKEALLWKLKLLRAAASYANSRLHAIKAEVLVLASGKDNLLPSVDEAKRLRNLIKNCKVRIFKENGHTLFIEDGINLFSVIKGTSMYRRSWRHDFVADFQPPTMWEYKTGFEQVVGVIRNFSNALVLSTLEDGTIVRGLSGVPSEGPILLVGNHMLLGFELFPIVEEFLREKKVMVRGLAHPELFAPKIETPTTEFGLMDWLKVFGATPVTASNLFKLFSTKSHVLLYPGGAREAFHFKGEEYKLFWPDQPEFVRMAARFGATIVPFGAVGEDDLVDLVLDYDDLMKIPVVNDFLRNQSRDLIRVRKDVSGELGEEQLFIPGVLPKIPGRLYCKFGKPITTRGKEELLKDKDTANELYLEIKTEVEQSIAYLLKKREEDPYRNIFDRAAYKVLRSPLHEVPAFEP